MLGPDKATMIMPPPPLHSASPSKPAPRSKVHSTSPEIRNIYPPSIVKRMQVEKCFVCHKIGHWSWDCPLRLNSPNNNSCSSSNSYKRLSSSPKLDSPSNPKYIYCRCSHGFCIVKTSGNAKNQEMKYYSCLIERGKPCTEFRDPDESLGKPWFLRFCSVDESFLQPLPYKYPEGGCRASVCEKIKDPDVVRKDCFTCPVAKGHRKCDYRVSRDELLHNNKNIVPIQQSRQEQYNLGEQGESHVEQSKRMRTMNSIETPLSLTVSELPEGENATTPEVTPSRCVAFPEFHVKDDLQEVVNSVPWNAVDREAVILSHQSTRMTSSRKKLFGNTGSPEPFADASFVTTQEITFDDNSECNKQLAITNISENAPPPSNGCMTEVCGDVLGCSEVSRGFIVSPSQSQGSQRKPMSKSERERQMALVLKQGLLADLEDMDPHDRESMRKAVDDSFLILNGLSVDSKLFFEHVLDFMNHATSVADIENSMENFLTFEEYNRCIEVETARFSQMQGDFVKSEALLKESNQRKHCLHEEVSHLEAMLYKKQKQLNSCEGESLKIETQLVDLKMKMAETNKVLKGRIEEAELARRLNQERETKQISAKTALEKAKLELIN